MEHLLTIKNLVAEAPERAMHMELGFRRRLEAREANSRLGVLVGAMRDWVKHWIRVLEVGEGWKLHGHYVAQLHPFAVEWGVDHTLEIIDLNRSGFGLERCSAEWVRDAEWVAKYLTKTWRNGESRLVGGRAFQCSPGVKRFRDLWRNEEWLAGVEEFLALHGCRNSEEASVKLGPFWAYINGYAIGKLGREALATRKMNL